MASKVCLKCRILSQSIVSSKRFYSKPAVNHQKQKPNDAAAPQTRISPKSISIQQIQYKSGRKNIPRLSYDLDRVLFNPGVYYLQDPRSRVYNFDPYLQNIMSVEEFDYNALGEYITSSRDTILDKLARENDCSFVGSTSSMTAVLAHFHYLLSSWRPIDIEPLSSEFADLYRTFTQTQRAPAAVFLRHRDGVYAIDADKSCETGDTILSALGKSMEKLLTMPSHEFEKFRRGKSHLLDSSVRNMPEAYNYCKYNSMLMRSQLDCQDPRLPGTGVFDLKTRAVVAVRMDVRNSEEASGYQIKTSTGLFESFEREYYDMIRSAFLKYSLQVRIGNMDGIFVAFHNTERIFGFQYIGLDEMDYRVHGKGGSILAEQEFKFSISLLHDLLQQIRSELPGQSVRIHVETRETRVPSLYIFAEAMEEETIEKLQQGAIEQILSKVSGEPVVKSVLEEKRLSKSDQGSRINNADESAAKVKQQNPSPSDVSKIRGWQLTVTQYVNGVETRDPPEVGPKTKWEIVPKLTPIESDKVLSKYEACKLRRIKLLGEDDPSTATSQWSDQFRRTLQDLARRGRKELEERGEVDNPIVWKSTHTH